VSKSTVIANGIPHSSVQAYLLPIACELSSIFELTPYWFKNFFKFLTTSINFSLFEIKGKIEVLTGAIWGGKVK